MESTIPVKSKSEINENTLNRWLGRKVQLYIPSFEDGDELERWATGTLIYREGIGFFVQPKGFNKTAEPIEYGDYMRIIKDNYYSKIRPVSYVPELYIP